MVFPLQHRAFTLHTLYAHGCCVTLVGAEVLRRNILVAEHQLKAAESTGKRIELAVRDCPSSAANHGLGFFVFVQFSEAT